MTPWDLIVWGWAAAAAIIPATLIIVLALSVWRKM